MTDIDENSLRLEAKVVSRYRLGDIAARLIDVVLSTPSTGRLDSYLVVITLPAGRELPRCEAGSKDEANRLAQTIRDCLQRLLVGPVGTGTCATPPGGATTYTYDSRGNRTSFDPPAAPVTALNYDQASRLAAYGSTATYAYNGDGLRTAKTVSGVTTGFAWGLASELPMLLLEGTTAYVYGPGGLPVEQVTGGTVRYYHHDQLGSTRAITSSAGAVVATYTFDPYGKLTGSTGSVTNPFGYAGQYTDSESGYQYLRARYYDPETGQFLTRDPLEPITATPYAYVGGNPLNGADPERLLPHIAIAGAIGGVVGGVVGGVQHVAKHGLSDPRGLAGAIAGGAVGGAVIASCSVATGQIFVCSGAGAVAGNWLSAKISGSDYS